jgi:hypothetical protein
MMKKELRKPYPNDQLNSARYAEQRASQSPQRIAERVVFLEHMNKLYEHFFRNKDNTSLELLAKMYASNSMPKIAAIIRKSLPLALILIVSLACMSTAKIAAPLVTVTVTGTKQVSTSALVVTSTSAPTSAPTATYKTLCGNVNVRDNPSSAGKSYGNKLIGESVQVLEMRSGWVRVGRNRWITRAVFCP